METIDRAAEAIRELNADSVYVLVQDGWSTAARTSPWHMVRLWAHYLPTVVVAPESVWPGRNSRPVTEIANCTALRVVRAQSGLLCPAASVQTAQILEHMRRARHARPVLWLYNASFAETFAIVPAAGRVVHAIENHFQRSDAAPEYLKKLQFATRIADFVIAGSDGIAISILHLVQRGRIIVQPNGCDAEPFTAKQVASDSVRALRTHCHRLGVYAGTIDRRLDFSLIARAAQTMPDTMFLLIGTVESRSATARALRTLQQQKNVRWMPAMAASRLPALYAAADFGFIPYINEAYLTENAFPHKAFEMAAAGLPVVSSFLRALMPFCPPLAVAQTEDDFMVAVKKARRVPEMETALRRIATAYDYRNGFALATAGLAGVPRMHGTRFDCLAAAYPEATVDAFFNLARRSRYGNLLGNFLWHSVYGWMVRLVDRLPVPMRDRVIRTKRAILGH